MTKFCHGLSSVRHSSPLPLHHHTDLLCHPFLILTAPTSPTTDPHCHRSFMPATPYHRTAYPPLPPIQPLPLLNHRHRPSFATAPPPTAIAWPPTPTRATAISGLPSPPLPSPTTSCHCCFWPPYSTTIIFDCPCRCRRVCIIIIFYRGFCHG